ncbi:maltokinase N-terminal cap-like domain-containing protein [Streptomyces sp. bgisy153]|uniref:maltokinase N-terminal cap-like domain-containing protein n=1 Tax=Streptomyces sp. bgisy153 TaxID=3413793 RepID=UPI003D712C91
MAVIHHTVLRPSKLELLAAWLPSRPWYRGGAAGPELVKSGGFRLDDPEGEVGIEFMVVTDVSGPEPVPYLVPLTYRGAPLDGAEHALVGTMEHGVLGRRWAYDGCHDPVLAAQLTALLEGREQAQDQNTSDLPDREITASYDGAGPLGDAVTPAVADDEDGTELTVSEDVVLRLRRTPRATPEGAPVLPQGAIGHVTGAWQQPDGTHARGLFAVLRPRA